MCHLDADMTRQGLHEFGAEELDFVVLENVGNLVCPAEFDTGSAKNAMILSVPEGDDKPLKYPGAFVAADLVLLTKMDLCSVLDYNLAQALHNVKLVHPEVEIIELSSRRGDGMDKWMEFITNNVL